MQTPITNQEILAKIDQIMELIADSHRKDEILSQMNLDNRKGIVNEVRTQVASPMLTLTTRLASLVASADDLAGSHAPNAFESLRAQVVAAYELATSELENGLNIETFTPEVHEQFDPKIHTAIETHPAPEKIFHSTIAVCHEPGYRDVLTGRVLRPAKVTVFKEIEFPAAPAEEAPAPAEAPAESTEVPAPAEAPATAEAPAAPAPAVSPAAQASEKPAPTEAADKPADKPADDGESITLDTSLGIASPAPTEAPASGHNHRKGNK